MPESLEGILELLLKYNNGTLTKLERDQLDNWVAASPKNRDEFMKTTNQDFIREKIIEIDRNKKPVWDAIVSKAPELASTPVLRLVWPKYVAAAAVILSLGIGYLIYQNNKSSVKETNNVVSSPINDVLPGSNRAVLTLANGSQIVLDSANNGSIPMQGNTKIEKANDGSIAYKAADSGSELLYNQVVTPRGGQYKVVLPDNSVVFLNAASSIRYPTAFTGTERVVELTGEAYFEVAKRASSTGKGNMPFIVKIKTASGDGGEVQVLGTHFNINAYSDEVATRTTLLEGSVKVSGNKESVLLTPGEQSMSAAGMLRVVKNADMEEAVAWKNGVFVFRGANMETIMRQVARWYDVDVVFEGKISQTFEGQIPRSVSAATLLKVLSETEKIKFTIQNKKIVVAPAGKN